MSCYNCAKSYSLFNREHACPQCGFGFCSRCLQNKIKLPKSGKNASVCRACYKTLTQPKSTNNSLIEDSLKALESPPVSTPIQPITVYKKDNDIQKLKKGLSSEDQDIVDRLESLKKSRKKQTVTDDEIAERLAKLQGKELESNNSSAAAEMYRIPEARSQTQQADDLMKQISEETKLAPASIDEISTEDISARLAKLRGISIDEQEKLNKSHVVPEDEELSSDEEADKIVQRILDECKIEEQVKKSSSSQSFEQEAEGNSPPPITYNITSLARQLTRELKEEEELPWCVICNEDAKLRCIDCSEDLYCQRCFIECHGEFELDHKTKPYRKI